MPIYEFMCPHCDHAFESLMKPHDPVHCTGCGLQGAVKLVSAPGVYKINGDNSASTSPRARNAEMDRKLAKRERVDTLVKRQGVDLGYDKAGD